MTYFILYASNGFYGFSIHIIYARILYPLWTRLATFAYHAGFFNTLYNVISINMLTISYKCANKFLDKGIFEYLGPFGIYKAARSLHYKLKGNHNVYFNVFFMFLALVFSIFISLVLVNFAFLPIVKHIGLLFVYIIGIISVGKGA